MTTSHIGLPSVWAAGDAEHVTGNQVMDVVRVPALTVHSSSCASRCAGFESRRSDSSERSAVIRAAADRGGRVPGRPSISSWSEPVSSPGARCLHSETDSGAFREGENTFRGFEARACDLRLWGFRQIPPRGCGEQGPVGQSHPESAGPSPRARGAGAFTPSAGERSRTIPAGAGSSAPDPAVWRRSGAKSDHPRGRGEQTGPHAPLWFRLGPSPRARGAGRRPPAFWSAGGTIPAGAGSSSTGPTGLTGPGDHPRGRGEQLLSWDGLVRGAGPSPRARGAVDGFTLGIDEDGTIPAGAGSRDAARRHRADPGDHPRGRGEQGPP